jgi:hypothetical protein
MFHFIATQSTTTTTTTIAQTTPKLWYKRNQSKANNFYRRAEDAGFWFLFLSLDKWGAL